MVRRTARGLCAHQPHGPFATRSLRSSKGPCVDQSRNVCLEKRSPLRSAHLQCHSRKAPSRPLCTDLSPDRRGRPNAPRRRRCLLLKQRASPHAQAKRAERLYTIDTIKPCISPTRGRETDLGLPSGIGPRPVRRQIWRAFMPSRELPRSSTDRPRRLRGSASAAKRSFPPQNRSHRPSERWGPDVLRGSSPGAFGPFFCSLSGGLSSESHAPSRRTSRRSSVVCSSPPQCARPHVLLRRRAGPPHPRP